MGTKNAKQKKKPQSGPEEKKQAESQAKELETTAGEQGELIDVSPENSKEILRVAKRYKAAQIKRINALTDEKAEKEKLLDLIKKGNYQRLDGGKIRFSIEGFTITVVPRDELIQIKDENESDAA